MLELAMPKTPKTKKLLVSVLMAAYNAEFHIRESIESVLKQNYPSFELLIMEDGSCDRTWQIIQEYSYDSRVRMFKREHRGIATTRNELVSLSNGEFIAMHDSDDIMLQGKLKTQSYFLFRNKNVGVVYGNCLVLDELERPVLKKFLISEGTRNFKALIPRIPNCSAMIRKTYLLKAGFYDSRFVIVDDADMWTRLSQITKFKYINKYFYIYRLHKQSITQRMPSILEKEEDVLVQTAIDRTNARAIQQFKLFFHEVQLNVSTNSTYIKNSIQNILYIDRSHGQLTLQYDFELHEVPSLQGIYPRVEFSGDGDYQASITDSNKTFYWKSNQFQFICKISREEKKSVFYIKNAQSLRPEALIERALLYPLIFLMRSQEFYFVHSGCVAGKKGAVMISGPTLSGKTTLSLMLVQRSYKLLSDEANILFMRNGRFYIKGFPIKPKIKEINFPKFPVLIKHRGCLIEAEKQKFFFPVSLLKKNSRNIFSVPLRLIICPQYQTQGKLKVSKMSCSELLKLISDTNFYSKFGINSVETLNYILVSKLLYRDIPVYKCQYSDESIEDLVAFIEEHLGDSRIIRSLQRKEC